MNFKMPAKREVWRAAGLGDANSCLCEIIAVGFNEDNEPCVTVQFGTGEIRAYTFNGFFGRALLSSCPRFTKVEDTDK